MLTCDSEPSRPYLAWFRSLSTTGLLGIIAAACSCSLSTAEVFSRSSMTRGMIVGMGATATARHPFVAFQYLVESSASVRRSLQQDQVHGVITTRRSTTSAAQPTRGHTHLYHVLLD